MKFRYFCSLCIVCVYCSCRQCLCVNSEVVVVVVAAVGAEAVPCLPCCVWLVVCGHGPCGYAGTGHLTACSSGSSSDIHKGAPGCERWRGAVKCRCMKKSFRRRHMLEHPPQSFPGSPGSPGRSRGCPIVAELWTEE